MDVDGEVLCSSAAREKSGGTGNTSLAGDAKWAPRTDLGRPGHSPWPRCDAATKVRDYCAVGLLQGVEEARRGEEKVVCSYSGGVGGGRVRRGGRWKVPTPTAGHG